MDTVSPDGALLIRLQVQVEQLTSVVNDLRSMIQGGNGPAEQKLAKHEQHVNDRLHKIETVLDKMSNKLEERSKFPFMIAFAFTSLLLTVGMGIGSFFLNGVNQHIARIDKDIVMVQQSLVPRAEHNDRWRLSEARGNELSRRIEILEQSVRPVSR